MLTQASSSSKTKASKKMKISMAALKLAVALQLKQEGYVEVVFDKPVEACGKRVKMHVFAEDEIGTCAVVWCITKPSQIRYDRLAEIFDIVEAGLGLDCKVAVAIPISLIGYVDRLIGLTYRVYMLDMEGKVWVHDAAWPRTKILPPIGLVEESSEEVMESRVFPSRQATGNFYII